MANKRKRRSNARPAARRARTARAKPAGRGSAARAQKPAPIAAKNATPEEVRFLRRHADALSKTTQRAKWIHSPDEHEDRAGQSLATRRHEVIRHWAEERGGRPATVGREYEGRPGVLRFNFPGFGGGSLREISWEDWFRSFDDRELVFLFQEHKRDGKPSNFFRLDSPKRERA